MRRVCSSSAACLVLLILTACRPSPPAPTPTNTSAAAAGSPAAPELPSGWTAKTTQYADRDMVAAANPLAVDAGVAMLAQGGSAVDAAIAVQMMLTLVEPQSSGIGGGAFLIHYDAGGDAARRLRRARDGAGRGERRIMFLDKAGKPLEFTKAVDGGLSVGTPGIIKLFELVHEQARQAAVGHAVRAGHHAAPKEASRSRRGSTR